MVGASDVPPFSVDQAAGAGGEPDKGLPAPMAAVIPQDVADNAHAYLGMALAVLAWRHRDAVVGVIRRVFGKGGRA